MSDSPTREDAYAGSRWLGSRDIMAPCAQLVIGPAGSGKVRGWLCRASKTSGPTDPLVVDFYATVRAAVVPSPVSLLFDSVTSVF